MNTDSELIKRLRGICVGLDDQKIINGVVERLEQKKNTLIEIHITDLDEVRELLETGEQWRKAGGEAILEREELRREIAAQAEAVEEMRLIKALTEDEGNRVTIHHPNPDFDGPEQIIQYYKAFELEGQYGAPTLLDCLQQAAKEHLPDADT